MAKKMADRQDSLVTASARALRVSPQKLSLVADTIRGADVSEALAQLQFSPRRIAGEVSKVLSSAIANAENNNNMNVGDLYVHEIYVGKALRMKRFQPRAKGRAGRILKPFSRLTIVLGERAGS